MIDYQHSPRLLPPLCVQFLPPQDSALKTVAASVFQDPDLLPQY
jgi:hypothetical protein